MKFLVLTLVSCSLATLSHAADIRVVKSGTRPIESVLEGECSITLSGPIKKGDADKLDRILEDQFTQQHDDRGEAVCLDSPGGSLDEGINIAAVLGRHYAATVVPAGASCLSACAVAFMGGTTAWYEYWFNARMMHATAEVGFHAPKLEVPTGSYDQSTVEKAFNIAISAVGRIAQEMSFTVGTSNVPLFPQSLLGAMLQHHGSDFVYVDTVELAATWDIMVLDARPANLNQTALETACFSAERWLVDQPVFDFDDQSWILVEDRQSDVEQMGDNTVRLTTGGMFISECEVKVHDEGGLTIQAFVDGVALGEGTYNGWAAHPPNTKLRTLAK